MSSVKFSSVFSYFFNFLGFLTCTVAETLASIILLFCSLILFPIMKLIHAHYLKTPKILKNYKSENIVLPKSPPLEETILHFGENLFIHISVPMNIYRCGNVIPFYKYKYLHYMHMSYTTSHIFLCQ